MTSRDDVIDEVVRAQSGLAWTGSARSYGTAVDLEDAVLAVLCEQPGSSMTTDEVQAGSIKYLGYKPERSEVVIALNMNPKVTSLGNGSYRGDCS